MIEALGRIILLVLVGFEGTMGEPIPPLLVGLLVIIFGIGVVKLSESLADIIVRVLNRVWMEE